MTAICTFVHRDVVARQRGGYDHATDELHIVIEADVAFHRPRTKLFSQRYLAAVARVGWTIVGAEDCIKLRNRGVRHLDRFFHDDPIYTFRAWRRRERACERIVALVAWQ